MSNLFTVPELAKALGLSAAKVNSLIAWDETSPVMTSGSGRFKFYKLEDVREALIERNRDVLTAVGYFELAGQNTAEESE